MAAINTLLVMPERVVQFRRLRKQSIGDMREAISLEARSIQAPVFGSASATESYSQIAEVWAKVETHGLRRLYDNGDVQLDDKNSTYTHTFTIRYRTDVTSETRIRYRNELYRILSADDMETRKEYLSLKCRLLGDDETEVNQ